VNRIRRLDLPRRLPVSRIRPGRVFWRIHATAHEALWFGPKPGRPPLNRFDDSEGKFQVCYLAVSAEVAFAERFLRNPPVRIVSLRDLEERSLTAIRAKAELRLVRMHGPGLSQLGVTAEVSTGADYRVSQALSRALWEHPDEPHGILYRPRHDDSALCAAIFNRASQHVKVGKQIGLAADPHALAKLLRRYGLGFTF
jgi:hypothetical protein